jgi:hypothetical protein
MLYQVLKVFLGVCALITNTRTKRRTHNKIDIALIQLHTTQPPTIKQLIEYTDKAIGINNSTTFIILDDKVGGLS